MYDLVWTLQQQKTNRPKINIKKNLFTPILNSKSPSSCSIPAGQNMWECICASPNAHNGHQTHKKSCDHEICRILFPHELYNYSFFCTIWETKNKIQKEVSLPTTNIVLNMLTKDERIHCKNSASFFSLQLHLWWWLFFNTEFTLAVKFITCLCCFEKSMESVCIRTTACSRLISLTIYSASVYLVWVSLWFLSVLVIQCQIRHMTVVSHFFLMLVDHTITEKLIICIHCWFSSKLSIWPGIKHAYSGSALSSFPWGTDNGVWSQIKFLTN